MKQVPCDATIYNSVSGVEPLDARRGHADHGQQLASGGGEGEPISHHLSELNVLTASNFLGRLNILLFIVAILTFSPSST